MAENQLIENSEYAGSESVTARELPDLHFIDNFESDSNESGINLWGSKVIYNEEIAQEGDPLPLKARRQMNTDTRPKQKKKSQNTTPQALL